MTRLSELDVVVIDCQATGASPEHGELLELGWATLRPTQADDDPRGGKARYFAPAGAGGPMTASPAWGEGREAPPYGQVAKAELVLLPLGESIPPPVARLTGLTEDDLEDARTPGEVWASLRADAAGIDVAVIHYARFEESFLRPLHGAMVLGAAFPFEVICTHAIARRLWPDLPRCGLRAVAGYLGMSAETLRRSAGHVEATLFVWREVVSRLVTERGVETLSDLRDWLEAPVERSGVRVYPMPRDKRLALPTAPGVYRMLRSNGDVLYVGKASSLRRRVNSYFQKQSGIPERTLEMLSQARDVDVSPTSTVLEAALLEADEIKQHAPPYNVALRGTGRSLWYAAPGFASLAPDPSARHPIGPLSSSWWPGRYAALLQALQGGDGDDRALVAALGHGADEAEVAVLERGLEELRHRLPPGGFTNDRVMMRFGALRWEERKAEAALPDCDDTPDAEAEEEPHWDVPRVLSALEDLILVVAHAIRRAAWLRRLSEASIAWSEPGRGAARHVLVLARGRVEARERIAPGALPPSPPGATRSASQRYASFDLATYDRLRVLTTELRRLVGTQAPVTIRLGPGRPLTGTRLARTLDWV